MGLIKHIPNLITLSNLACGCLAIAYLIKGELQTASYLIWAGLFFDFSDGFVARLTKSDSKLGEQLDSLADVVTFGVVPSTIVYQIFELSYTEFEYSHLAFLMALAAGYRLARFNVSSPSTGDFEGLPTPTAALLVSALPFLEGSIWVSMYSLIIISVLTSLLMISKIPLIALKFKSFALAQNIFKYVLLITSLILLITLQFYAIPFIFILYFIVSFLETKLVR